jgi:class 3 adenylate cyclase
VPKDTPSRHLYKNIHIKASMSTKPALPSGTVTFLFTDIEGSTRRWEQHPEAMRDTLVRHDELLRSAIQGQGRFIL